MNRELAIGFFIAGTLLMVLFFRSELLLFFILSACSLACLAIDKWKNVKTFLIAMLIGGACENIAVGLGAWSYSFSSYLYAPLYLPVGWGMSVVLLEEAFAAKAHQPKFSKSALFMAFGGTIATGISFASEIGVFFCFIAITFALFAAGYYQRSEIRAGLLAAVFGTAMETANIMAGNWHYSAAMLGTPIWLPLCWFNAFLIMRRIAK